VEGTLIGLTGWPVMVIAQNGVCESGIEDLAGS
jgi:hypothetical protein